ncbi:PARP-domain-containing protein [Phanerochaete sordida]|uniref:Poly [ADP-ribose] polymerase n=1 Tax=Phanerochaete sordida TaxID=48140 RepID=A0A9P3G7F8_9APHY|nr:PARP-domain-containing protein [Phanerochaete sordida]
MPPRKKAAAATAATDGADAAPARATRSSARTAAKASAAASVAVVDPPADAKAPAAKSKAKPAAKGKGKGKRARDEDEEEEEEEPEEKPKAKRAKKDEADVKAKPAAKGKAKGKKVAAADDEVEEEEEEEDDKPKSKKAKKDAAKADDEVKKDEPKKMVTVVKRGAAPVDPHSGMVDTHQVYVHDGCVWDAMLNQTDIGKNSNKFYVIQLLHPIGSDSSVMLFTRWGRVGETGQKQTRGPFPAPATGIYQFKDQFKKKAACAWEARHNMVARPGKYTYIERSFEDDDKDKKDDSKGKKKDSGEPVKIPDSTLPSEVQELCRLIFSSKIIDAHLSSMNYDANKLPLGKLAKSTILNGFSALKTLSEVIQDQNCKTAQDYGGFNRAVETLTGRYYSIIPHNFGRNRPRVINSLELLKNELDLVDALGDMEIASKLISSDITTDPDTGLPVNPLDAHFKSLALTSMDPVSRGSGEWATLESYVRDTHGATHHTRVSVANAFRVERAAEAAAFIAAGHDRRPPGERMLLWHGSRTTNFAGILKQGLRIAPPEAPVTGYMFGKGVYFADMMSKSANYCYAHLSGGMGLLLLCEVAAQPFYARTGAEYNADVGCRAAGALATKGLGRTQPVDWQDAGAALAHPGLAGVHMPKGRPRDVQADPAAGQPWLSLQYNEYIVYDTSQIRLRYLLMVQMS